MNESEWRHIVDLQLENEMVAYNTAPYLIGIMCLLGMIIFIMVVK